MKVVLTGDYSPAVKETIRRQFPAEWELAITSPALVEAELHDADVLIPEHLTVDAALLEKAPRLRLVQTGAGYDNVDIAACTARGIWACNAAGVNASAVAEHAMALLLAWYKNIPYLDSFMRTGRPEAELDYAGGELTGKTVGILGLGATGKAMARRCMAFDMKVLAWHYKPVSFPGAKQVSFEELLERSDVISLHLPLTPETRGMFDASAFRRMKPGALLINTARGGLVDQDALVQALKQHLIRGACLDVFVQEPLPADSPLRSLPNVLLTPHTAGKPDAPQFHQARYAFFAENIRRVISGLRPEHPLNDPVQGSH